jgi:superfamily II DNA or RNA helicase
MKERLYQSSALCAVDSVYETENSAILVLPTGAGKTIVAALYILRQLAKDPNAKFLFLQHTDELIRQNLKRVASITGLLCSLVKGRRNDFLGTVVFASVPTLSRPKRLAQLPKITHMIVDECHHAAAKTWTRIIKAAHRLNDKLKTLSMTALLKRGDGQSTPEELGSVAYQVYIRELVEQGFLVPMRAFSINIDESMDRIAGLKLSDSDSDFDQVKIARVIDAPLFNNSVVDQWINKANGIQTIAYCTTIQHAKNVAAAFVARGIAAEALDSENPKECELAIERYRRGETTVLVNCMMLTEGFDHPPTGCIIVLRAMHAAITFVQALGRALRIIDPAEFPGVVKTLAICLDFTGAAIRHQELDEGTILPVFEVNHSTNTTIRQRNPAANDVVYDFARQLGETGTPISDFKWEGFDEGRRVVVASGLKGATFLVQRNKKWLAFGRPHNGIAKFLRNAKAPEAFSAASDFIRTVETNDRAHAHRLWLKLRPTAAQWRLLRNLNVHPDQIGQMSRYEASCYISYLKAAPEIEAQIKWGKVA